MKSNDIQMFLMSSSSSLRELYTPEMEVQVNVSSRGGIQTKKEVMGKSVKCFEHGSETWNSFRIPWNADGNPCYKDSELSWSLSEHVEAIGLTGWNWVNKESIYVGFDIDAISGYEISGHKSGLSKNELSEIELKLNAIPWTSIYRSTGGYGIHLYVHFKNPIPTATHSEHAALARSILPILTMKTGLNFQAKTDCVGSVLWVWHEKIESTKGLRLIKEANYPFDEIPNNWRENLPVIQGRAHKTNPSIKGLGEVFAGVRKTKLDKRHQILLKFLDEKGNYSAWWDNDWGMLICHTLDLQKAFEELDIKGVYKTISSGSSDQNCFCYPLMDGGWVIRRYGKNINEHPSWTTDNNGWTKCYYNIIPSFKQSCLYYNGVEGLQNWFVFNCIKDANDVLTSLNIINALKDIPEQEVRIKNTDYSILVKVRKGQFPYLGFAAEGGWQIKIIHHNKDEMSGQDESLPDQFARATIDEHQFVNWFAKIGNTWIIYSEQQIKNILGTIFIGKKSSEVTKDVGRSLLNPWKMVTKPFKPEYPGNREWNRFSPQFAFAPVQGEYPNWRLVFNHIGKNINQEVAENKWCKNNSIQDGADYLFTWVASMFQKPSRSLPYLALVSDQQNTGKSTFHQGLREFFKGGIGYIRANNSLTEGGNFNGELRGAILAICEEIDLRNKTAYNKIKDWVTGQTILITTKFKTSEEIKNNLHFIHCMNNASFCPVFPGDTRITMITVSPLTEVTLKGDMVNTEIPEEKLHTSLIEEAPALLYDLLKYELPEPEGRLGVPVLSSEKKEEFSSLNSSLISEFISENTFYVRGDSVNFKDFYNAFKQSLLMKEASPIEKNKWNFKSSKIKFPSTPTQPLGMFKGVLIIGNTALFKDEDWEEDHFFRERSGNRLSYLKLEGGI